MTSGVENKPSMFVLVPMPLGEPFLILSFRTSLSAQSRMATSSQS